MSGIDDGEDVEIPWWTYGARGMQLWFPKSLAEPVSHAAAAEAAHYMTDPELEFDREVYPISISLAEVSIIGACAAQLEALVCHCLYCSWALSGLALNKENGFVVGVN